MPDFFLRTWSEQVLFDCNDYCVTADTLEDAVEQLQELQEAAQNSDEWQRAPVNIRPLNGMPGVVAVLDPEEVVEGYDGVTLIDENGKRVRDLDGVPTGCVQLGEPLDGPQQPPKVEPFPMTFVPGAAAVNLLAEIANDVSSPHRQKAVEVLEHWRCSLATPEQIAMVDVSDDLEIDSAGACVSESDDGFFIQTWTWVNH